MVETLQCDLCVIGASQMGASVVLIECGQMGSECLYSGCVPSKALSAAVARQPKVSALAQTITPYPTLSEVGIRAASSYYALKVFSPCTKRIVRLHQRLG